MELKHVSEHAVLGPTMAIPVTVLDSNWMDSEWYGGLTVTPLCSSVANRSPPPIRTSYVRDGWLHLPRFRGIELVGMVSKDRRSLGEPMNPDVLFGGSLKPNQTEATSRVMDQMRTIGGAMLVLPCGFGKTVCSIWIMSQLRRRTLVLVHTGALADQWEDRISTFYPGPKWGASNKMLCEWMVVMW